MRVNWRTRRSDEIAYGLIYGTIAILALAAARFLPLLQHLPPCLFRSVTGIPCPACGSGRSLVLFAQGHLGPALAMNPLFTVLTAGAVAAFLAEAVLVTTGLPLPFLELSGYEARFVRILAVVLLLSQWAYFAILS